MASLISTVMVLSEVMLLCSQIYWGIVLPISALLNLILYFFVKKANIGRLLFVFTSCCMLYLTLWGLITRRGTLSNLYANPVCLP